MKAIAIDFDGCICTNAFPNIGAPNRSVIDKAIAEQAAGAGLILWTCREGELLQQALDACAKWGLHFDAVNESLPSWIAAFGTRPRKVGASEYCQIKSITVVWYMVAAAVVLGFMVAYAAMFGFDKLKEVIAQLDKNKKE